jgi:hypothetical protein
MGIHAAIPINYYTYKVTSRACLRDVMHEIGGSRRFGNKYSPVFRGPRYTMVTRFGDVVQVLRR